MVSSNTTTAVPGVTAPQHPLSLASSLRSGCPHAGSPDTPTSHLNSTDDCAPGFLRQSDHTLGDLTSLFASSSPGDLLDDAEINELIHAEGIWSNDQQMKTKLKPLVRSITRNGLVSRRMYRQFSTVIVYIAFPFIIVGCVTNVMALKVFRGLARNVTNTYMTCLICFDMAYLLFVVSSHIVVVVFRAAWAQSSVRHCLQLYVVYKFFILSARQVSSATTLTTTVHGPITRYIIHQSSVVLHTAYQNITSIATSQINLQMEC